MKKLVEQKYGTGGRKSKLDLRDRKIGKSAVPFNWSVGYSPTDASLTKDQGQSDSCGGQAGSYLNERLKGGEQSAKSIYSLIWYKGGGTTTRDILNTIVKRGVTSETSVPSQPATESNLEDKSWQSIALLDEATTRKGLSYAFINTDIESIAQSIRDIGGCILLIQGQNNGSWLSPTPVPPANNTNLWAHFLFAGKAFMKDGKKVIAVHNSWGDIGDNGWQYLTEDYFKSEYVIEAGVIYEPANPVITITQQKITIITKMLSLLQEWLITISGPTKQSV